MKIIFLDIDGVLNSRAYDRKRNWDEQTDIDETRLPFIKEIVDATDARIVLSSTWRQHWNKDPNRCDADGRYINKTFAKFGLVIYDKTPDLGIQALRRDEIRKWLDDTAEVIESFVIIDDYRYGWGDLSNHFVKTDPTFRLGIEKQQIDQAIKILNAERQKMEETKKIVYIKYTDRLEKAVKNLLLKLQQHLENLDERRVIVVKDNYAEDYFNFVMEEIKKYNGEIFVALEDLCGAYFVVGMVVCKIFQGGGENEITTSCPKIGFISDLVVSEDYRGLGIGTQLISKAENYFSDNNCDYTQLEVFAPNTDAYKLYKKLGYEENCYYMSKKVQRNKK